MAKATSVQTVPFKRLVIGAKFKVAKQEDSDTFKKISESAVYLVNPNGNSQTHQRIPFPTGNTACVVVGNPK